ncbi:MAG TPA: ABC transporter permease [Gemmatimonadaceae bacterium]|nr:ABC transporter permease [Gemmatimonadaceae bacterium]
MSLIADARYALRQLARSPGFTIVALFSLAIGIGANTTVFTVANTLLFQRMDVARPDEMVRVYSGRHSPFTFRGFMDLRERTTSFSEVIAEEFFAAALQPPGGEATRAAVQLTSGNLFTALGKRPALGRLYARTDDRVPSTESEVVLGHRFWSVRLGSDSAIIGRTVSLNGSPFRVIGVAPAGFNGAQGGWRPDVFVPLGDTRQLLRMPPDSLGGGLYITARRKAGVTLEMANADVMRLAQIQAREGNRRPDNAVIRVLPARGITEEGRGFVGMAAVFAQVVAALVLIIACANIGNLLLGRSARRRREIGIRLALGARRRRLIQQLLTEGSVLALAGTAVALLLTTSVTGLLSGIVPADLPIGFEFGVDGRVLLYAAAAAVVTVVLFALAPALVSVRQAADAVRDDSRWASPRGVRLRSALLMVQIALGSVLLVGAMLFTRSLAQARVIDPGFPTANLLDVRLELGQGRYSDEAGTAFYERAVERLRNVPGVTSAAVARLTPLTGGNSQTVYRREGDTRPADAPMSDEQFVYINDVGPGYFATMQIPLVSGREFASTDRSGAPDVVVISAAMAARVWPNESALGKRISVNGPDGPWREVVGVARDVKFASLSEEPTNFVYFPSLQSFHDDAVIQVRAAEGTDLNALGRTLGDAVRSLDPVIAPPSVRPTAENQRIMLIPAKLGATLMGVLGLFAALLAGLGMFGVTSYLVAQRTREIGVRMALGARPRHVLGSVLGSTGRLVVIGAAIGCIAAYGFARLIASQLYGVSATDPITFLVVPLALVAIALLASYLPARRALGVDPTVAMRAE